MISAAKYEWNSSPAPDSLWATDAAWKVPRVSPDMALRTAVVSIPVKGILKPPSWPSLQQQCPPPTAAKLYTVHPSFALIATACAPEPVDAASRRRRCVSFSDNICRWHNQGSSPSLNTVPMHRTHPSAGRHTQCTRYHAAAAPIAPPMLAPFDVVPAGAAVSRQGNHVWSHGSGTGRVSRPTCSRSSSQGQPPCKPKRATADADLNAPMRKPQRRKSNETEPPIVVSDNSNGNVFQSSVQSFLMNARVPARSASSSSPAAFACRNPTQAMDMS